MPPGQRARLGNLDIYDAADTNGAVVRYFERHRDVTAIVRGITVESIAHEGCTRRILTGTPSSAAPDMGAICAATGGSEFPLPYMILGASAFIGQYAAQSGRVGSSNQLVTLLQPNRSVSPSRGRGEWSRTDWRRIQCHGPPLERRLARLRNRRGRFGQNGVRLDDFLSSMRTRNRLTDFGGAFGGVGSSIEFTQQIDVAMDMLQQGVVWSVALDTGLSWDSHTTAFAEQTANNIAFFDGLSHLVEQLKARNGLRGGRLIDETAVVVVSEMGRTPMLNEDAGKDHWQVTCALTIGSDVNSNTYGKSTDTGEPNGVLKSEAIDFETGQPNGAGRHLESADFVAGVLDWAGCDAASHLPNAIPFRPWAARG